MLIPLDAPLGGILSFADALLSRPGEVFADQAAPHLCGAQLQPHGILFHLCKVFALQKRGHENQFSSPCRVCKPYVPFCCLGLRKHFAHLEVALLVAKVDWC